MPLTVACLLAVIPFFAVMAVLKVVLPAVLDPIDHAVGLTTVFVIGLGFAAAGLAYGTWPHDETGRMRPLSRCR